MSRWIVGLAVGFVLAITTVAFGAFLGGPMGQQPDATPQMRIMMPNTIASSEPVSVSVAYHEFDLQPQLRCGPAGPCTGTSPQTVVDGRAQGHIHVYLQAVSGPTPDADRESFQNVDSDSFCIPTVKTPTDAFNGTVSGNCPAVPPGLYRVTAEFQSNSHVNVLKQENRPQDVPTSDATYVRAVGN